MVDFKVLLEKNREKNGYCSLSDEKYASIDGVRTNATTGVKTPVKIYWLCDHSTTGKEFKLLNGVTGFESWYVKDLVDFGLFDNNTTTFCACAGTPNRWDALELDLEQVRAVVKALQKI